VLHRSKQKKSRLDRVRERLSPGGAAIVPADETAPGETDHG
jgi:hypothetical protein